MPAGQADRKWEPGGMEQPLVGQNDTTAEGQPYSQPCCTDNQLANPRLGAEVKLCFAHDTFGPDSVASVK